MNINLFPLGIVAFPNKSIPLHIFEERYKKMINNCMNNKEEFGVVYQNKKGIANVGCTVNVTKLLKKYSDGRMDIMSKGNKIYSIRLLLQSRISNLKLPLDYHLDLF